MTKPPVQLDPPDPAEPAPPPFPDIPAWETSDGLTDTTASLVITEAGGPVLVVTHGDPDTGPYQMLRIELDAAELARLAADTIAPLVAHEAALAAHEDEQNTAALARSQARADACAFVVMPDNLTPGLTYQVRLHRNGCPVAVRVNDRRTGVLTHGGDHTGAQLMTLLDRVENALAALRRDDTAQTDATRAARRAYGVAAGTGTVYEPLKLCGTCKPLGPDSPALARVIREVAAIRRPSPEATERAGQLMRRLRELVWETEQAHLDTLRHGDHDTRPAPAPAVKL